MMPGYAWVIIWVALSVAAIFFLGSVLWTLARSGMKLQKEIELHQGEIDALNRLISEQLKPVREPDNLLDDPAAVWVQRLALLRAKNKRHRARQHRLISKLQSIKPEERTFDA